MSKPMVVTLPFVLLLLDFWPLARVSQANAMRLLTEKIPFFVLAATGSVMAFVAQKSQGAVTNYLTMRERLETAVIAYVRYIGKFFYPTDLAVLYPHPVEWPKWEVISAFVILLAIFAAVIALRKSRPYLLTGWLWFFGTLIPVIGLVQIGSQSLADRYTYIPSLGLLIMLLWGTRDLARQWKLYPQFWAAGAGAATIACLVLTERQLPYWKNSGAIFGHAIAVTENNFIAEKALADFAGAHGHPDEAITLYQKALKIYPGYVGAHLNLGALLNNLGQHDAAVEEFKKVIQLEPGEASAYNNLGAVLGDGHLDESITLFKKAIELAPGYLDAHKNLGQSYDRKGMIQDAINQYEQALKIQPDADAEYLLGLDLEKSSRREEAVRHLKIAAAARPVPNPAQAELNRLEQNHPQ